MGLKFSRLVSLLTLTFLFFLFSNSQISARWRTADEADIECLKGSTVFKVNKDGTWTRESETQMKVLTEAGRKELSIQTFSYDATRRTLEILEAKTKNKGIEFIIPKEKMENKPLASDCLGLREERQILIPFECVAIGSIVHLKVREHCFKPALENYFSTYLSFGAADLWHERTIRIESELPFFTKVNDPCNSLDVCEDKNGSQYTLQVSLKKPICERLIGESLSSYGENALYTSLSVSTEKDYERIGKLTAKLYQPVVAEPLPQALEDIRSKANDAKDEVECINIVVTELVERITYFGSWNVAEDAPRSLETIVSSGYGDCKEYSACLAVILKKLNYQTNIASVKRDKVYLEEEPYLPSLALFNHAILKAVGPSGKTYWIDPTNTVSMAGGIFPDIADRPALVLDLENPTYERIPPIDYRNSRNIVEQTNTITDDGYVKVDGLMYSEGEASKILVEDLIMQPRAWIEESIIKHFCLSEDPIDPKVNLPEYPSRIVRPLKISYSYTDDHIIGHSNLGRSFPLKSNWHIPYIKISQTNEGALYVKDPITMVKKKIFKNLSAINLDALAFSIQTPWVNAKRELSTTEEGLVVTETIERLKSLIPAKDLKTEEFNNLKRTLRKYCDGVSIIFSK